MELPSQLPAPAMIGMPEIIILVVLLGVVVGVVVTGVTIVNKNKSNDE